MEYPHSGVALTPSQILIPSVPADTLVFCSGLRVHGGPGDLFSICTLPSQCLIVKSLLVLIPILTFRHSVSPLLLENKLTCFSLQANNVCEFFTSVKLSQKY